MILNPGTTSFHPLTHSTAALRALQRVKIRPQLLTSVDEENQEQQDITPPTGTVPQALFREGPTLCSSLKERVTQTPGSSKPRITPYTKPTEAEAWESSSYHNPGQSQAAPVRHQPCSSAPRRLAEAEDRLRGESTDPEGKETPGLGHEAALAPGELSHFHLCKAAAMRFHGLHYPAQTSHSAAPRHPLEGRGREVSVPWLHWDNRPFVGPAVHGTSHLQKPLS